MCMCVRTRVYVCIRVCVWLHKVALTWDHMYDCMTSMLLCNLCYVFCLERSILL